MEDKPTEITVADLEKCFEKLLTQEIKKHQCFKCSKEYYGGSYGHHISECDECWFSRFPKDQVEAFYRSFL